MDAKDSDPRADATDSAGHWPVTPTDHSPAAGDSQHEPRPRGDSQSPSDSSHGTAESLDREPASWERNIGGALVVCLSDVKPEKISWLWKDRIPLGKLTLFVGDPDLGKSFVTIDIAARVSKGSPWPDRQEEANPSGSVVLLQAEDGIADTVRPRLDKAGADVAKVHAITGVKRSDDGSPGEFSLKDDLAKLEAVVEATAETRLVIIDPITAYLGKTDSHRDADVRALLAPLAKLAERHQVAVVAIMHLNKTSGTKAMYRPGGSLAFTAAARAAWLFIADKDDSKLRLMLPLKMNIAPDPRGIAYRIVNGAVSWDSGLVLLSADAALAASEDNTRRTERDDAKEFLKEFLRDGPRPSTEVLEAGIAAGITKRTLERAKRDLGVKPEKEGLGGRWTWGLPKEG